MLDWQVLLWRAAGGAAAMLAMYFLAGFGEMPVMLVPFATSIVLVLGMPEAEPAQPRALVGGHLLSAAVGIAIASVTGPSPWAGAIAVGVAMALMHLTRTFHPPADIDPLIIVNEHLPWTYFFIPVAAGTVLLACFAFLWHNARRKCVWPSEWWQQAVIASVAVRKFARILSLLGSELPNHSDTGMCDSSSVPLDPKFAKCLLGNRANFGSGTLGSIATKRSRTHVFALDCFASPAMTTPVTRSHFSE